MYTEGSNHSHLSAAWHQVASITSAIESTLGKWLSDKYGIGLTEYRAIIQLSRAADHELRIAELANQVGLDMSSATRLVGRMENKELAFRDTCPDDARGVYAVITDRGLSAIEEIRQPYEEKILELLRDAGKRFPQVNLAGLESSFATIIKAIS